MGRMFSGWKNRLFFINNYFFEVELFIFVLYSNYIIKNKQE